MATFNDLPKLVEDRIYRLHLLYDEPITYEQHMIMIRNGLLGEKRAPPLLEISKKFEKEPAAIYYGENTFDLSSELGIIGFTWCTWPRHMRLVRNVICTWDHRTTDMAEKFHQLARMKSLVDLTIRTDEREMVRRLLNSRNRFRRTGTGDPTPQQQLVMLQYPGMSALLSLGKIKRVQFTQKLNAKGEKTGGPISGGVLETQVAPRLMRAKLQRSLSCSEGATFPFLSLPPELRNRIYDQLLRIPGPVELSTKPATSASKKNVLSGKAPESVLNLLAVNHQIHDEAVGIFYNGNSFIFNYSIHLHALLQILGHQRQTALRDITVHYVDLKSGGMSMVDLTFSMLKHLTGLRSLEVVMHGELSRKITGLYRLGGRTHSMRKANPGLIPGMKPLFGLRSVTDIQVRDVTLEEEVEATKKLKAYPNFAKGTRDNAVIKLEKALAHLNIALADAQKGNVTHELLEDNEWHMQDVFPTLGSV